MEDLALCDQGASHAAKVAPLYLLGYTY
jgi:hypothetical protein